MGALRPLLPRLAAGALLARAAAALTAHVQQLAHVVDNRTMFGSTAMVPQSNASDPIFLTTSWVYAPLELVAYENGALLWRLDTSKDGRQMWVVSGGAYAATAPGALNAAAFWIEKDVGITGNCSLAVFDAARSPFAAGNGWRRVLEAETCALANLALNPTTYAELSRNGSLVVALTASDAGNVTIFALEGQTGALRWARSFAPTPAQKSYWTWSGVHVSPDGEFVSWSVGELGGAEGVRQHVAAADDGKDRGPSIRVDEPLEPPLSLGAEYTVSSVAVASGGERARVLRWNASAAAYTPAGADIDGPKIAGILWYFISASLSFDPMTGVTFATLAWSSTSLNAAAVVMYNVDALASGPVASYHTPVSTGDMDSSGVAIACFERLCACGFYPGSGVAQPTFLLLDASAKAPVWNTTTAGSVLDVAIAPGAVPETYYVSAAGCTTPSICTDKGAEAFVWGVTFTAD